MTRLVLFVLLLAVPACGGSPSAPSLGGATAVPPTADIQTGGQGGWTNCLPVIGNTRNSVSGACQFQGPARNVGTGCATAVRGTLTFRDSSKAQVALGAWSLPSTQILRPNEAFTYLTPFINGTAVPLIVDYLSEASATAIKCP